MTNDGYGICFWSGRNVLKLDWGNGYKIIESLGHKKKRKVLAQNPSSPAQLLLALLIAQCQFIYLGLGARMS